MDTMAASDICFGSFEPNELDNMSSLEPMRTTTSVQEQIRNSNSGADSELDLASATDSELEDIVVSNSVAMSKKWKTVLATPSSKVSKKIAELFTFEGVEMVNNGGYSTTTGCVRFLKCSGYNRYKCPIKVKCCVPASADELVTIQQKFDHDHSVVNTKIAGVPQHVKARIKSGILNGKRPRDIYKDQVLDSPETSVTKDQVKRSCKNIKKKLLSELPENTLGFLNAHLSRIVLHDKSEQHEVGALPGWKALQCGDEDTSDVLFVLTSKRLLYVLVEQAGGRLVSFFHVDGTYSLTSHGFPVLVVGTVDSLQHFKLVAICVVRHDSAPYYADCLRCIQAALSEFHNYTWNPIQGMRDGAYAIHNGVQQVFPLLVLATCYFHVKQAIKKNKNKFRKQSNYNSFSDDVAQAHSFMETAVFSNCLALLQKKWQGREPEVIAWFQEEWCNDIRKFWHAGATAPGLPKTNNPNESYNNILKKFCTKKERVGMGQLLRIMRTEIKYQSVEAERTPFNYLPENNRGIWIRSQITAKGVKNWILKGSDGTIFMASDSVRTDAEIASKDLKTMYRAFRTVELLENEKFDEYVGRRHLFYCLKPLTPPNGNAFWSCTCPYYAKKGICKHSLGLAIHKRQAVIPAQWIGNRIESLRKMGRPKGATNCYGL
jgi:hypothetical protein